MSSDRYAKKMSQVMIESLVGEPGLTRAFVDGTRKHREANGLPPLSEEDMEAAAKSSGWCGWNETNSFYPPGVWRDYVFGRIDHSAFLNAIGVTKRGD